MLCQLHSKVRFEIVLHEIEYRIVVLVALLLEVPDSDLTEISKLDDQVQVVMVVVIDHLVKLCDVRVVKLRPDLNLVVHLIEIVDHLHLALLVVSDRSLASQCWFVHHFHREFCNLIWVKDRPLNLLPFFRLL